MRLNQVLQSRDNNDALILLLCYVAQLGASILDTPLPSALKKLTGLLPNVLDRFSTLKTIGSRIPLATAGLSSRLRNLSEMLDDWSTLTRLWGLIGVWASARDLIREIFSKQESEPAVGGKVGRIIDRSITASQTVALTAFLLLENAALLSRHKVLNWSPQTHSRAIIWCIRFWGFHVFSEVTRLLIEKVRERRAESVESKAVEPTKVNNWTKRFVETVSWAPLVVHASTDGGFLPEPVAAGSAAYAMFLAVHDSWRSTA